MAETPSNLTATRLETSVRRLIQEEDPTNTNFTSAEIVDYLNEGVRQIATKLEWQLAIFTTNSIEDQATYTLPGHVLSIVDIYFNNSRLQVIDRSDLADVNGDWMTATPGEPRYAYRADRDRLGLYPTPSTDYADKEIRIQVVKLPDTLVDTTDVPDIHISFQDALPYFAAFRCEMKAGNNQRAADFLKLFQNGTREISSQLERFADRMLTFRF